VTVRSVIKSGVCPRTSAWPQAQTKLYDRDRGLLRLRGNDDLLDDARRDGKYRMVETARENGIIEQARDNAEDSIRTLVPSLGYREVMFK
jgi:hypothetical protein